MLIILKHRYYYYRRFEHDIWGLCFLDMKASDITYKDYLFYKNIKANEKFLKKHGHKIIYSMCS